jgi:AAHS family 3-hydroxyphenylpropionic acid transporter
MTGKPHVSGEAGASSAWLTVALCFGVMVIEGFDIQAMGVAAPALGPELKLSREVLGQALSASNIGLVIGAILGGWLADVFGRKPVLVGAVTIFGVFTLMTMQASSFEMLFAARLLTGLGFGGALPNVMAVAADVSSEGKRGTTAAMMFCGMPVGGSAVALLSWLGYQGEWRPLFLIGGIVPLVLAPALFFLMKETQKPAQQTSGMAQFTPWLAALPLGLGFWYVLDQLSHMPGAGSVGGVVAPWLGGVLGLLGAYMIVHRGPLFGGGRSFASLLLWLTFFPTLLILYLVLNWLPTLVAAKGFKADASLASVLFNLFSVVGALFFGPLVDRFGLRWPLTLGFLALIGVLIGLAQASDYVAIMALSGALGFFLLGANYALYGAAAAYYPGEMRGRGSGAAIAWGRLGSVAGPLIGGYLLQGGSSSGDVVYAMAPFALLAAVGVMALTFAGRSRS